MSTFKLSKNQEFHFLKRGRRFLSLLYSFNSDIDTKRLKDACVKAIQSVELLNYKLVDVSATFPLQSKGTADVNIDVTFDNEFTIEKFYRSIDRNDNQINPYQLKPLALTLIKSERIYLFYALLPSHCFKNVPNKQQLPDIVVVKPPILLILIFSTQ